MTAVLEVPPDPVTKAPVAYRWRWIALFVVLIAEIMDLLDATITSLAAVSIRKELGGGLSMMQWLAAGYTLAFAVGLVTGGRLGDLYGRKRMFVIGVIGFTGASVLCGLAVSPEMLIAARVAQGLAGAMLIPQGLGFIKQMFPPGEMGKAFGLFGPVMGLSAVGGPILAGALISADVLGQGWRMIFWINLPIGLLALAGALVFLPRSRSDQADRLDLPGMVMVSAALFLLVYPLVQGREMGWPVWSYAMMAAALPVFALFAWYESRRHRAGRSPLVVPSLFAKREYVGGLLLGLVFFAGLFGFSLVITLYLQMGLGFSPLKAGLAGAPQALGIAIGSVVGGNLVARLGRRVLHLGAVVMAAGIVGLMLATGLAGSTVSPWQLLPGMLVAGVGMGLVFAPYFDTVLAGVEPHETGSASGTLTATQQVGNAAGAAAIGTLFFSALGAHPGPAAFGSAMQLVLVAELAILAVSFGLMFLLPKRAAHVDAE